MGPKSPNSGADHLRGISPHAALAVLTAAGDLVYEWSLDSDEMVWLSDQSVLAKFSHWHDIDQGDDFNTLIDMDDLPHRLDCLSSHLARQTNFFDCEYRITTKDGQKMWVQDRGAAQFSAEGKPTKLYGTLRIITDRKVEEERLKRLAHYDELTGYFNAAQVREALDHALSYCARHNRRGVYLAVGIDNLSLINNALGSDAADAVIVEVARRIERLLGMTDIIGRIGGDHFGIILHQQDNRDSRQTIDLILSSINKSPIETEQGQVGVTVSIGAAHLMTDGKTSHDVMARAEVALHAAKRGGRNCVVFYRPHLQPAVSPYNLSIGEEVRQALRDNRFCLAFQPVVSSKNFEPEFYECLARIRREDGSLLNAGAFIPAAEQLGLMREIDYYVCKLAVGELLQNPDLKLAINISGFNVGEGSWMQQAKDLLRDVPQVAERLTVEITETAALSDIKEAANFVHNLREMGCQVALDDFGAGYTSYRQLRLLPVNMVKIDGSFVKGVNTNVGNQLFVRTLVELAHGFGLKVIAEFVETQEDAETLTKFGVGLLQGMFFGEPQQSFAAAPRKVVPITRGKSN